MTEKYSVMFSYVTMVNKCIEHMGRKCELQKVDYFWGLHQSNASEPQFVVQVKRYSVNLLTVYRFTVVIQATSTKFYDSWVKFC